MQSNLLTEKKRAFLRILLFALVCLAVIAVSASVTAETKKVNLRENQYYYSAFNKRDPFLSLIVGDFIRKAKMTIIDLNTVELVGIVRGELDRFALLEDVNGYSYILRVGDRVTNGSVVAIGEERMIARVTNFGQTTKLTLHLSKREEGVEK